jgi:chromosome segregation ATPase
MAHDLIDTNNNNSNTFSYSSPICEGATSAGGEADSQTSPSSKENFNAVLTAVQKIAFQRIQEAENRYQALETQLHNLEQQRTQEIQAEQDRAHALEQGLALANTHTAQLTAQIASQDQTIARERGQRESAEKRINELQNQLTNLRREAFAFSQAARAHLLEQQQQFATFRNSCMQEMRAAQNQIQNLSSELGKEHQAKEDALKRASYGERSLENVRREALQRMQYAERNTNQLERQLERMKQEAIQNCAHRKNLQETVSRMEIEQESVKNQNATLTAQLEASRQESAQSKQQLCGLKNLQEKVTKMEIEQESVKNQNVLLTAQLEASRQESAQNRQQLSFESERTRQYEYAAQKVGQEKAELEKRARFLEQQLQNFSLAAQQHFQFAAHRIRVCEMATQQACQEKAFLEQKTHFLEGQLQGMFLEAQKRVNAGESIIQNLRASLFREHQNNEQAAACLSAMQNHMTKMNRELEARLEQQTAQYKLLAQNLEAGASQKAQALGRIAALQNELSRLRSQKSLEISKLEEKCNQQNKEKERLQAEMHIRELEIQKAKAEMKAKSALLAEQKASFEKTLMDLQREARERMHGMEHDMHLIRQAGSGEAEARKMAERNLFALEQQAHTIETEAQKHIAAANARSASLQAEIRTIQFRAEKAEREKQNLQGQLVTATATIQAKESEISTLAQKLARCQEESREKAHALELQISSLTEQLSWKQHETQEARARCSLAEGRLRQLQSEAGQKLEAMENERRALSSRLADVEIDRFVLIARKKALDGLYAKAQTQLEGRDAQLRHMAAEVESQKQESARLDHEIKQLEEERIAFMQQATVKKRKLQQAHENTEKLLKAIDTGDVAQARLRAKK